jgi:hypothetical protein
MKFIIGGNYTDMNAADEYKSPAALSAVECELISVNNENV